MSGRLEIGITLEELVTMRKDSISDGSRYFIRTPSLEIRRLCG